MVQFATGTYTEVRESHTEWKYEKVRPQEGMEWPKDKLRKEMAKTCWFTTFTPWWSNRANPVKWRNLPKTVFLYPSLK